MKNNKVTVGIIQQANDASVEQNKNDLASAIEKLASQDASLVVLQELHNTLYFCQNEDPGYFDLAEPVPGPSTDFFGKLAKKHGIVMVLSLFEKRAAGIYHNTAVVMDSGGTIAGKYRKMHIPDDPGFYEKFYFTPGDCGFEPIKTSIGSLGILVCWDQWYPEAARLMAMKGADLLIYPTAIGWDQNDTKEEQKRQLEAWTISQRAHAVHNALPVISVNRVGFERSPVHKEEGILFWGNSFICGAQGEILYQSPQNKPDDAVVEIDLQNTESVRRIWPFFRDRRIDAYDDLNKRFLT
jgi:N-carbamoylputrescine amidase